MPMPNKGESHRDYISRCMGDSEMNSKHPDAGQRYAICEAFWNKREFDAEGAAAPSANNVYVPSIEEPKKKKYSKPIEEHSGQELRNLVLIRYGHADRIPAEVTSHLNAIDAAQSAMKFSKDQIAKHLGF